MTVPLNQRPANNMLINLLATKIPPPHFYYGKELWYTGCLETSRGSTTECACA